MGWDLVFKIIVLVGGVIASGGAAIIFSVCLGELLMSRIDKLGK